MRRSYRFRAYPTRPQEVRSGALLRDHCDLYNAALEERREAWRARRVSVSYGMQSAQLKDIRRADPGGHGRHSFNAQQHTLRRLDSAFGVFYKRCKAGEKKPGYPRFKSYERFNQVLFVTGQGAKWEPVSAGRWAYATFRAVGRVKVHQHRTVPGAVKALRLQREGRRWYVIAITETEPVLQPPVGCEIGVDLGVARFLTTSDGEVVSNPRFLSGSAEIIAALQRRKSRAEPGSGNRKRLKRALAKEHRKVRARRRDFHHKTARKLVDECDAIALEKLNAADMTRRPAPRPDPEKPGAFLPNNAATKTALNGLILDAGWYQFTRILEAKAEEAGRRMVLVSAAYTSITCHQCGRRCERPEQRTVVCPEHGAMDADVNGAINIATRAGLGSGQAAQAA